MSLDHYSSFWPSWGRSTNWSSYRDHHFPPLWHFHRVVAGRRRQDEPVASSDTGKAHVMEVDAVDWMHRENASSHHTAHYELMQERRACVIRRGGSISLAVAFKNNRAFDLNRDHMKLVFEFGDHASVPKGTKAVCKLQPGTMAGGLDSPSNKSQQWEVRIPVDVPVGLWRVTLLTWYGDRVGELNSFLSQDQLYILFNPFNQGDPVHMSHPSGKDEYLFNETGKLFGGSHNKVQGRPWVFGQFRDSVLPAVCHLLTNNAGLRDTERSDAIKVCRAISAMVNSIDDAGVLLGRWDGHYEDGTKPFEWTGSVPILETYMAQGGKPVKYGQCWVFSGVVTTICRALGIPCRSVTNYVSAHDTNSSLSVDKFYDENGELEQGSTSTSGPADSIWNFHVWNEVWLERRDLPGGHSGWQVIDATPQEESESLYQCGPTSVEAVRKGEVGLGFDTAFVFTEVNADVFAYLQDKASPWGYRLMDTNTSHVGKLIVTKALGYLSDDLDDDFQDITDNYKHREGSFSERRAMMKAARSIGGISGHMPLYPGQKHQDVFLQMIDLDKGVYGEPYNVSLFLHNQSKSSRTIRISMSTSSMFYTGNRARLVKQGDGEFVLTTGERETLTMSVDPEDYMPKTVEYCQFMSRFLVKVKETGQTWTGEDDFILEKPKLQLRVQPDAPRINRTAKVFIKFANPLKEELNGCVFALEGPGISQSIKTNFRRIEPKERVEVEVEVRPWRSGPSTLVAAFNCQELFNVTGAKKVNVLG